MIAKLDALPPKWGVTKQPSQASTASGVAAHENENRECLGIWLVPVQANGAGGWSPCGYAPANTDWYDVSCYFDGKRLGANGPNQLQINLQVDFAEAPAPCKGVVVLLVFSHRKVVFDPMRDVILPLRQWTTRLLGHEVAAAPAAFHQGPAAAAVKPVPAPGPARPDHRAVLQAVFAGATSAAQFQAAVLRRP